MRDIDAAPEQPPHHSRPLAVLAAAGLVLFFAALQGLVASIAGIAFDPEQPLGVATALDISVLHVAGIATALALVWGGLSSWRRIGVIAPRGSFARGLRMLAPVGLLVIGPPLVYALVTDARVVDERVGLPLAAALSLLALLIAIDEELWFRGLVVDRLGGATRPLFVVLSSAVLFGLPHYAGSSATLLNAAAVGLAVGIPFAVVRLRAGSIWPLVTWHFLIDAWAFLHTSSIVPEGAPSVGEIVAALVLPTLIALGYLAVLRTPTRAG